MELFPEFGGDFNFMLLLRLAIAAVLGGIIGLERGGKGHDAGLRTHIIVCLGAAAVMIVGELISLNYSGDPTRMAAQVISGIGFLGAGSIMMSGGHIRGITTAAGIWTTACIGIVVGAGYFLIAAFIVAIMLIAMWGLRSFGQKLQGYGNYHTMQVDFASSASVEVVLEVLSQKGAAIKSVRRDEDKLRAYIEFELPKKVDYNDLVISISRLDEVVATTSAIAN